MMIQSTSQCDKEYLTMSEVHQKAGMTPNN